MRTLPVGKNLIISLFESGMFSTDPQKERLTFFEIRAKLISQETKVDDTIYFSLSFLYSLIDQ